MGKINIIACGGAGINITSKIKDSLLELGNGFADISINYIDTSVVTIQKYLTSKEKEDSFFLIQETKHNKDKIDGSGGERITNASAISSEVKRYLDEKGIFKKVTGEIYVVISSGSSGSGSVTAPLLVKSLLERDIPTIAILVNDTSNHLYAINSKNTLATYHNISLKVGKPIVIYYLNNDLDNDLTTLEKMQNNDIKIYQFLSVLMLFLSGENTDIDYQDMVGLISPDMFTSFKIQAGLYDITAFKGKLELPKYCKPLIGRTLTIDNIEPDTGIKLHSNKTGEVLSENAIEKFNNQWPLSLVLHHGSLKVEMSFINDVIKEYEDLLNSHTVDDLFGSNDVNETDDGLIL